MSKRTGLNKKAFILINIIVAQAFVVLFMGIHTYVWIRGDHFLMPPLLPVESGLAIFTTAGLLFTVAALALVHEVERMATEEVRTRERLAGLEKAEDMVRVLRSHRHDFLNHLSVISGFIQLGKYEEAVGYIKEVTGDLKVSGQVVNLSKPGLAALILTKMNDAETLGVKLQVEVETKLAGINASSTELVSLLGNLVDNALYAVKDLAEGDRRVRMTVKKNGEFYCLVVANRGPHITEKLRKEIFKPGFTTKGSEGSGYGLYIVKNIVQKNGGRIELASEAGGETIFTVYLPRRAAAQ